MSRVWGLIVAAVLGLLGGPALAQPPVECWNGPFGGTWSASFAVLSDYAYAGISSTERHAAVQLGLAYASAELLKESLPTSFYVASQGSNVQYPATGPGIEVILGGGLVSHPAQKLEIDIGYLHFLYPDFPATLGLDFDEWHVQAEYDFKLLKLGGRVGYVPNALGQSGVSWNKRGTITVPLPFVPLPGEANLKLYGALGNFWIEKPENYGIGGNEYWYWEAGVAAAFLGFEFRLGYTATSLDYEGCANTDSCAGRAFASLTKTF